MSKKIIALVLAFAMMFSTITVAFAEEAVSAEAQALATVGMLEGDGNGVTVEYTAKEMNRLTAAISLLKLKGLYADALAFNGESNFADADTVVWAEGRNILAYLKANPALGFAGDATTGKFNPYANIDEQSYVKVLLETLGYKQTTAEVTGDFAWEETVAFAGTVGLVATNAAPFTIDALAKLTVSAFKAEMKNGGTLINALVDGGKVDKEKAIAAGLYEEGKAIAAAVDTVTAIGNTVVEVVFEEDVDAAALANLDNYAVEGLEVSAAVVAGTDTVRLTTAAQTAGKLYTLTIGAEKVNFTGIAKVTGTPDLLNAKSEDIEEVVLTFDKALDFETAADVANYTISGVEIAKAEVDGKEVTLTTVGLAARKQYTVKATNVKSVDGSLLKSDSVSFYTRPNTTAPTVDKVEVETNQRVIVTFSKEVTKESAENLENYVITTGTTELAVVDAKLATSGDYEDRQVELTTEVQAANKRYELEVSNIVDTTKSANAMKKAVTKTFYGMREDTTDPTMDSTVEVISRNLLKVVFKDASRLDEASVLDANNYTLTKSSDEFAVEKVEELSSKNGEFKALVTVEDLAIGTYTLKVSGIADEFGNDMSEVRRTVNVSKDSVAAATISKAEITGENEIVLTFTKALKEDSAENIANYSIDGEIGAPVSATYDDDAKTVTLETIDLKDNVKYDITVNGVEDLAGNVLDLEYEDAIGTGWDSDAPELEDVYVLNNSVIALAFDEEIGTYKNAELVLAGDDESEVTLYGKVLTDGDMVVEFSDYGNVVLDEQVLYTVVSVTGIKDVAGKDFTATAEALADYKVYGSSEEPEAPEVLNAAQVNGKYFELTMSMDVEVKDAFENFTLVDVDDAIVTLAVKESKIVENKEYKEDLTELVTSLHGVKAIDLDEAKVEDKTVFYGEYEDDEKPYIVNVVAVDRFTVEIEYSEELSAAGTYTIKNADEDIKGTISASVDGFESGDKKVVLKLTNSSALEGRYDYKLVIGSTPAEDLVGGDAEEAADDEFYFNGTDIAPVQ